MMTSAKLVHIEAHAALESAIVAVVEDDEPQRVALAFQLETADYHVTVYRSAESFLEAPESKEFDCVVADICMPRMNGLQLFAKIKQSLPFVSVIFVTGCANMSIGVQAMREGAIDCLEKPIDDATLLNAIRRGHDLARIGRAEHIRRIALGELERTLTPREHEVFALITSGLLNKQVGAELGPTEQTIKRHRGRVMMKMGAASLPDLVRIAEVLHIHPAYDRALPRARLV